MGIENSIESTERMDLVKPLIDVMPEKSKHLLDMTEEERKVAMKTCEENAAKITESMRKEWSEIREATPEEITNFKKRSEVNFKEVGCDGGCGKIGEIDLRSCFNCKRLRKVK
ncbi:MAG: hypothetical protein KAI57_00575 [Candidatus Pacebacteria bacterium]|nr:hypothetical protein [Candidatus Paceibacterota bacterium]